MTAFDQTVFIVDDDAAVRRSLEWLIRSQGLVAESFGSADEFLEMHNPAQGGCLLLDIRMPGMSGLELQERLQLLECPLPIIIITAHGEVPTAVRAMKGGAVDFIEKPLRKQELLERIEQALRIDASNRMGRAEQDACRDRFSRLTSRERDVMKLVVSGRPSKSIATELGISPKTVAIHRARIMEKTGCESIPELVQSAMLVGDCPGMAPRE
ncbi:MAG: response regulator transcription factor [Phycisphaerae bacterium]|nr:response regulator transcription factor [Phycisphaerae bacterium]